MRICADLAGYVLPWLEQTGLTAFDVARLLFTGKMEDMYQAGAQRIFALVESDLTAVRTRGLAAEAVRGHQPRTAAVQGQRLGDAAGPARQVGALPVVLLDPHGVVMQGLQPRLPVSRAAVVQAGHDQQPRCGAAPRTLGAAPRRPAIERRVQRGIGGVGERLHGGISR